MEGVLSSSEGNGPCEEPTGNFKSMYCKELVYGEGTEFSFEELRAQRYFKNLNERLLHLNKVKQELKVQIEQKQKLIEDNKDNVQHQPLEVQQLSSQMSEASCAPAVPAKTETSNICSKPIVPSSSALRNGLVSQGEDMGLARNVLKPRPLQAISPFIVHEEKPNTRSFSSNHNSLKLPTSFLKTREPASECHSEKDGSISHSEEAIINGHCNKTLCRSPNDTSDFFRAAQLASTPFGGPVRQNPSAGEEQEALNKTASVIFKEPKVDATVEPKKLSPIEEISHEWGHTSCVDPDLQVRAATISENTKVCPSASRIESASAQETETIDPRSMDGRKSLLDNMDLSAFANFNRKTGPLPELNDDLSIDGETLFFLKKMDDPERCLYCSTRGNVLVQVDTSKAPWDFYISSQLRARLPENVEHCHAQSSCYFYENGSLTLWWVPQGQGIQDLMEQHLDRRDIPLLAVQLLEMVKRMHHCRLVHGALGLKTLMLCNSYEDSVVISTDFSSSVDLELQPEVKMAQDLPSAQEYISRGLILPSASPYQVDLCGIGEVVHLLLTGRRMKPFKQESNWRLAEDSESNLSEPLDPVWQDFFHTLLNPEDKSTECVLSNLINNLSNALNEGLECPFSLEDVLEF